MAFLFGTTLFNPVEWLDALKLALPGMEFRVWPDRIGRQEDIEYLLLQNSIKFDYAACPNLKAIFTFGAGVDHVLKNPALPKHVPIVRMPAEGMVRNMTHYVLYGVLHFHRNFHVFQAAQRQAKWSDLRESTPAARAVGVLGLGELGGDAVRALADQGFKTLGWSRRPRTIPGVRTFAGPESLDAMLAETDILVGLLPLTPETTGLINARALAKLRRGAFVINAGRGPQIVDTDLIAALDSGHIAGAMLDVFVTEPLPADHPYWRHPKVVVTPHIASWNNVGSAAEHVAVNVRRIQASERPHPVVDRAAGY
ncbi:MAG: glyoxylate/hydroxypyruvate reductase A [Rhodospirillales bacterium]|nr:glyoxylate/hydroxypyruvate reductase A [Rhodospirillales bacterium]